MCISFRNPGFYNNIDMQNCTYTQIQIIWKSLIFFLQCFLMLFLDSGEMCKKNKRTVTNQNWFHLHPQLERQMSWFGSDKDMLYIIFTGFSCWFQPYNSWNDPMAEIRGQPLLGHCGPSLSACFGSNEGFDSSLVTAETGGLPSNFGHGIILRIIWLKSAWKASKNDESHVIFRAKSTHLPLKLGMGCNLKTKN